MHTHHTHTHTHTHLFYLRARQAVRRRDGGTDFQDMVRVCLVLFDILWDFAHELQLEGVPLRVELESRSLKFLIRKLRASATL